MDKPTATINEALATQLADCKVVLAYDFTPDGLGPLLLAGLAPGSTPGTFAVKVVVMSGTKDHAPDWAKLAGEIAPADTVPLDKLSVVAGPTPPDAVVPGLWKLLHPYLVQSAMSAASLGGVPMIGLGGPVREGKA